MCRLDSALCNHSQRPYLLTALRTTRIHRESADAPEFEEISIGAMSHSLWVISAAPAAVNSCRWISLRELKVDAISISCSGQTEPLLAEDSLIPLLKSATWLYWMFPIASFNTKSQHCSCLSSLSGIYTTAYCSMKKAVMITAFFACSYRLTVSNSQQCAVDSNKPFETAHVRVELFKNFRAVAS